VVKVSDGGLVVAGVTDSYGAGDDDLLLAKLDGSGNHLWTKTLGGTSHDRGYSVVKVSDGGLVVAGVTDSYGAGYDDLLLAKLDGSGNHLWTKTLGGTGHDRGASVVEVSDGGLVVAGVTDSYGAGYADLLLVKLDGSGNHLWTKTLGGTGHDRGASVVEVSDGGLVVTGHTYSYGAGYADLLLVKLDGSGNHLWTKTLGGTGHDWGISVVEVSDGGLVVAGVTYSYGAGDEDLLLAKLDGSGNHLWTKTLGGTNWDRGYSVVEVSDGGLVVAGGTESYGAGSWDLLLAKFDADGNTCMGEFVTPTVQSVSPTINTWDPTVNTWSPTITSPTPTITSPEPTLTTVCEECGDLYFRPNSDGWGFKNKADNMWPKSWWQQFNYCQSPYPFLWCYLCKSSDFPDWPLFVSAFGEDQCYWNPPPGSVIYKPSAVRKWFAIKGGWNGSCFGFAISSFLFFDNYLHLSSEFPGYLQLYSVPLGDESRLMINKYMIYQVGKAQQEYIDANYNTTTPHQTLQACKDMFNSSYRDDRILLMHNNHGGGGHTVNPYRCEVNPENPEKTYIYVCDSNNPGEERKIIINTATNIWAYSGKPTWGGKKHLFLSDPMSNYTTNPILRTSIPPQDRWANGKAMLNSEYIEFYISFTDTALFESPAGNIGHIGDSLFTTLSEGHPIISLTGEEVLPIGYYLPNDTWTCQFSDIADSTFRLSLFTDSTVIVYSRTEADSTQGERLRYPGNDSTLWVGNPDPYTRSYDLEVISVAPDSEIVCGIHNISIDQSDSACYSITPVSGLQLDNYGGQKTYDLQVEIVGDNVDTVFFHGNIALSGSTAHQIISDWRQNGDTLMVLVDEGMEGDFSDTIRLANEWVPVVTGEPKILPTEFSLSQNYPNPFNSTTLIKYSLPKDCHVNLGTYNILGQKVASLVDGKQRAGYKIARWDASSFSSGIYFYRLQAGNFVQTRKMVLIR